MIIERIIRNPTVMGGTNRWSSHERGESRT